MGGYQFLHIASFSRKSDAEGRTVDFVLAEASRRADACTHVDAPAPPEVVFGFPVEGVRELHDGRVSEARTTNRNGQARKLRVDHHTLLTAILSHPATVAEARENPVKAAEVTAWEERSIAWLQATWGENLVSVVRHVDEAHCHLHAFIVPGGQEMRARLLHPGVAAKDVEKAAAIEEGFDAKAANARGDSAYKSALRAMQDDFWHAVGLPSGLARLGPARRRLTRDEWRTEQAAAIATATALRIADEAQQRTASAALEADTTKNEADARAAAAAELEVRARSAALRASAMVATARQQAIEAQASADAAEARRVEAERKARAISARAREMVRQAEAEAQRIARAARQEAAQAVRGARRLGAWFGSVWHGLLGTAPATVARQAAGAARAEERKLVQSRVAAAEAEADGLRDRLFLTEGRLSKSSGTVATLSVERDRLAREVARLRPPAPPALVAATASALPRRLAP
jgi:hypothetical protein